MRGSKPSKTALGVARGLLYLSHDPTLRQILPERSAEDTLRLLTAISPRFLRDYRRMSRRWYRAMVRLQERLLFAGGPLHMGVRKRFFDDEARAALADGIDQVVLLGAGFDTLGLRHARSSPDVTFLAVDHPATLSTLRRAIVAFPELPNLHLLELDLDAEDIGDRLARHPAFQCQVRTLFLAEGLLMYLRARPVSELLRNIVQLSAPGSRFVFSFISTHDDGRPKIGQSERILSFLLAIMGEPMHWGVKREELAAFLSERGLELIHQFSDRELLPRYVDPTLADNLATLDWEYVATATTK